MEDAWIKTPTEKKIMYIYGKFTRHFTNSREVQYIKPHTDDRI